MKLNLFTFAGQKGAQSRRVHDQQMSAGRSVSAPKGDRRDRAKLYSARIWL